MYIVVSFSLVYFKYTLSSFTGRLCLNFCCMFNDCIHVHLYLPAMQNLLQSLIVCKDINILKYG